MTLDELRTLDFKDMPNWPLQGQLAALLVMILMVLGQLTCLCFRPSRMKLPRPN